ncbi:interleukin-12 subunit alpha [Lithobates pipiens]
MGSPTLEDYSCWILGIIVVLGQSNLAESKPTIQTVNFESCYNISKRLVNVVVDTLSQLQNLSEDFNCSYTTIDLQYDPHEMHTLNACLPQTCICSNINKPVTDKDRCLMSIHSDLKTFKSKLQSVNLTLPPLNKVTEEMMGALKRYDDGMEGKTESYSQYNRKIIQCTAILKFQRRAITISRIFSYLKDEASKRLSH